MLLGWLAVRSAVVNALARANPFLADQVAHDDPRVAIELAMLEFALRNGRVGPHSQARAQAALARSELADDPFLLAAVQAAVHGDAARSERLLTEGRRRNPRARLTRLLLLNRYLQTGRSDEAGVELAVLSRLIPEASGALVPQLIQLARDPKTRPGLGRILRRNPGARDSVLSSLAKNPGDASLVLELARESGGDRASATAPWQSALLDGLVRSRDYDRAYALWRSFLGQAATVEAKGLYDADFGGLPGAAPFNWTFATSSEGVAEGARGTLQVQYYGRGGIELASQLLMLKPGSYRLQFRVEGDAKGDGSRLTWTVGCAGSEGALLQLPLRDVSSAPRTVAGTFAVPAGCKAQWLRLQGSPGDVPSEQDVTIAKMQIAGAGK